MRRMIAGAALVTVLLGACGSSEEATDRSASGSGTASTAATEASDSTTTSAAQTTVPAVTQPAGRLDPVALPGGSSGAVARALVIADAGNSMLFDAEPAIAAALGDVQFRPHTVGALGLTVLPELWRGAFGRDVPGEDPAAVVVMLGNRDLPAVVADPDAYRAALDEAVRLLSSRGARILWLGLPPLAPDPVTDAARALVNTLFAELPGRFPGVVRYVPTDAVLGNPDGTWARTAPGGVEPIRKVEPDGRPEDHLCQAGAVRVAELVRAELGRILPLPPAPAGWDQGSWRQDARYDDPVGAC